FRPVYVAAAASVPPAPASLFFDGFNDNVQIADTATLRPIDALTIEVWVSPGDNFNGNTRHIFAKTVGTGVQDSYVIWYTPGQLHANVGSASGAATALVVAWNPTPGTWYHIAYTYDSTGPKLYINGALVASNNSTTTIGYDSHPVIIGDDFNNEQLGAPWSGRMRDVRLWNVALSSAQILASMHQSLTRTATGLIGY